MLNDGQNMTKIHSFISATLFISITRLRFSKTWRRISKIIRWIIWDLMSIKSLYSKKHFQLIELALSYQTKRCLKYYLGREQSFDKGFRVQFSIFWKLANLSVALLKKRVLPYIKFYFKRVTPINLNTGVFYLVTFLKPLVKWKVFATFIQNLGTMIPPYRTSKNGTQFKKLYFYFVLLCIVVSVLFDKLWLTDRALQ